MRSSLALAPLAPRHSSSWRSLARRRRAPERAHPKVRERGAQATTHASGRQIEECWRRGRDSNPRCFRTPLFESGTINHSDTSPRERIPNRADGRRRLGQPAAERREQRLRLVAADPAHDLDPAWQGGMLGQLDDRAGGAVAVVGHGEDERLDVALEQGPDAHRARLLGREDRRVGEPDRTELAGGLAQGDDHGVGRRVVRLLDPVVGPDDHRLVDHGHGGVRSLARGRARACASARASPMNSS